MVPRHGRPHASSRCASPRAGPTGAATSPRGGAAGRCSTSGRTPIALALLLAAPGPGGRGGGRRARRRRPGGRRRRHRHAAPSTPACAPRCGRPGGPPRPSWDAQAASATAPCGSSWCPTPRVEVNGVALRLPPPPDRAARRRSSTTWATSAQLASRHRRHRGRRPPRCGPAFGRLVLDIVCAAYTRPPGGASPWTCRSPAAATARRTRSGACPTNRRPRVRPTRRPPRHPRVRRTPRTGSPPARHAAAAGRPTTSPRRRRPEPTARASRALPRRATLGDRRRPRRLPWPPWPRSTTCAGSWPSTTGWPP